MNALALVRRLQQHRRWTNQQLLEAARRLHPDQLRQAQPIGQGSLWKTLTHLVSAEYVWLEAMLGNEDPLLPGDAPGKLPGNQEGNGAFTSLDELAAFWEQLDRRWDDYLAQLTGHELSEIVCKTSTMLGPDTRREVRRGDVLLHVCTHAQYTTAQAVNILRRLGADPLPDVMLISLAHWEKTSGRGEQLDSTPEMSQR
jgi:uncharacterized damage-inducible protein DinB